MGSTRCLLNKRGDNCASCKFNVVNAIDGETTTTTTMTTTLEAYEEEEEAAFTGG